MADGGWYDDGARESARVSDRQCQDSISCGFAANSAIAEEATEALPSLHSFGDIGVAREFGTCRTHPVFELGDKRCDPGLAKSALKVTSRIQHGKAALTGRIR